MDVARAELRGTSYRFIGAAKYSDGSRFVCRARCRPQSPKVFKVYDSGGDDEGAEN